MPPMDGLLDLAYAKERCPPPAPTPTSQNLMDSLGYAAVHSWRGDVAMNNRGVQSRPGT